MCYNSLRKSVQSPLGILFVTILSLVLNPVSYFSLFVVGCLCVLFLACISAACGSLVPHQGLAGARHQVLITILLWNYPPSHPYLISAVCFPSKLVLLEFYFLSIWLLVILESYLTTSLTFKPLLKASVSSCCPGLVGRSEWVNAYVCPVVPGAQPGTYCSSLWSSAPMFSHVLSAIQVLAAACRIS